MALNLDIGKRYNFSTKAPNILGVNITNMKMIGVVDYTVASTFTNIDNINRNVISILPIGTSQDPKLYQYYLFQSQDGKVIPYADVWIDETSVLEISEIRLSYSIVVKNLSENDKILEALALLGYSNVAVTQLS